MLGYLKVLSTIFLLLCSAASLADVYKWTDENGKIHYGDRPTENEKQKLTIKKAPAVDPVMVEQRKRQEEELRIADRKEAVRKDDKEIRKTWNCMLGALSGSKCPP